MAWHSYQMLETWCHCLCFKNLLLNSWKNVKKIDLENIHSVAKFLHYIAQPHALIYLGTWCNQSCSFQAVECHSYILQWYASGVTDTIAVEYHQIPTLGWDTSPGSKVRSLS